MKCISSKFKMIILIFGVLIFLPDLSSAGIERTNVYMNSLTMKAGEIRVFKGKNVSKIIVSNPEIIKALKVFSNNTPYLVISAKKLGKSEITVFTNTEKGTLIENYLVEVLPEQLVDIQQINNAIKSVFPDSEITINRKDSNLILQGIVKNKEELDKILNYLKNYTPNIVSLVRFQKPKQLRLDARIVEINQTRLREYGLNLLGSGSSATVGLFSAGGLTNFSLSAARNFTIGGGGLSVSATVPFRDAFNILAGIGDFFGLISFMENLGVGKTLSSPYVVAEEGKKAEIFVGGQIPVPVPQVGTANLITIEYKDFGIKLNFLPVEIDEKKGIKLKVYAEASDLDPQRGVVIQSVNVPAITKRNVESEITIQKPGDILVIGGLLSSKTVRNNSKVPGLGDIPILGMFFKRIEESKDDFELIVAIKPTLSESVEEPGLFEDLTKKAEVREVNWFKLLLGTVSW